MIHEILKILDTTYLPELEKQRITTDLLRLFNVVGQSEQLKAFAQHYNSQHYEIIEERFIDEYLKSNIATNITQKELT